MTWVDMVSDIAEPGGGAAPVGQVGAHGASER